MFFENIRFQLVSALFLGIIIVAYVRSPKLSLLSTKIFSAMLCAAAANLVFDIATVYAITHMDTVPAWLNRFFHTMFIASLDTLLYHLFLYTVTLSRRQQRIPKKPLILFTIPVIISLIMAVFGSIYYYNDGNIAYSYGPMVQSLYVTAAFYLAVSNIVVIRRRNQLESTLRLSIQSATFLWVAAALLQYLNPGLLISGVAVSLMMFYLYLSFENPRENMDKDIGCFNRHAMRMVADETMNGKRQFTVALMELDSFADMNRLLGFRRTDEVLRGIRTYVSQKFNTNIYRYSASAFAVITALSADEVDTVCRYLRTRLTHRFKTEGGEWNLNESFFIVPCPGCAQSTDELFDLLDFVLDWHEQNNNSGVYLIDDKMLSMKTRYKCLCALLESAVENDGFDIVLQPIYDTQNGKFTSAEALVRLKDTETLGFVSPEEFIPAAERLGIVAQIDSAVLDKVCAFAAEHDLKAMGIEYIEVNLSGLQATDTELPELLMKTLDTHGIEPPFINLEITETAAINSGEMFIRNMRALRKHGFTFAMDDFGTGYSNLSQIADTSYDLIKLDKSLIWPCFDEEAAVSEKPRVILRSAIAMVQNLHSQLVAEGIETKAQADALTNLGVHHLQGYYFSRPLAPSKFLEFIASSLQTAASAKAD